jgi:hypothetical protein
VEPAIQIVAEENNPRHDHQGDNSDKKRVFGRSGTAFTLRNADKVRKRRPATGEHPRRVLTRAGDCAFVDQLSC